MTLRRRIALPFALLLVILFAAVTVAAVNQVGGTVERRLTEQAENLARLLGKSPGLTGSRALPAYIAEATGAEVALVDNGKVNGEWTTRSDLTEPLDAWFGGGEGQGPGLHAFEEGNESFLVASGVIDGGRRLLLLYDPDLLGAEKTRALMPVLLVGGTGLLLVLVLAYALARNVARPLEQLSGVAQQLSGGSLDVALPEVGGTCEVAGLGAAFGRMVEGLSRHRGELVRAERLAAIGQMAAGIAHEIRNPLASMKMTLQMLREESAEADREPYDLLLREVERLDLAVSEVFQLAHPTRLCREEVALPGLIGEVLTLLEPQLTHLKVEAQVEMDAALTVRADRNIFKRAVMNLVLNGAQAMPGGGKLLLTGRPNGTGVELTVADEGPGLPEEDRKRIFEPFYTTKEGGTGMGLAVTRRVVEDHGGSIRVEGAPGGTRFTLQLPGPVDPAASES